MAETNQERIPDISLGDFVEVTLRAVLRAREARDNDAALLKAPIIYGGPFFFEGFGFPEGIGDAFAATKAEEVTPSRGRARPEPAGTA